MSGVSGSSSGLPPDFVAADAAYAATLGINTAGNAAGVTFALPAGETASGVTLQNTNATQWVRAVLAFSAGSGVGTPTSAVLLLAPSATISPNFDDDTALTGVTVQVVNLPPAGVQEATAKTPLAVVAGTVVVVANFINK